MEIVTCGRCSTMFSFLPASLQALPGAILSAVADSQQANPVSCPWLYDAVMQYLTVRGSDMFSLTATRDLPFGPLPVAHNKVSAPA